MLVLDTDTEIPRQYRQINMNAMAKDRRLILGGAIYLNLLIRPKVSADTQVRGSNNIIKRSLRNLFRKRGREHDLWGGGE